MPNISFGKPVFEGENIIPVDHDTYIVFDKETGQGEFIIPSIEVYGVDQLARVVTPLPSGGFQVDALCPNTEVLNHEPNKWSRIDENTAECSVCASVLDMRSIGNKAIVKEENNE